MTSKELLEEIGKLHNWQLDMIEKKNNDYAKNADAFSNFKQCADFADITVKQVFQVFIAVKVARLKELLNGKEAKNESVQDTLIDLANYSNLLNIYLEKATNTKQ